MKKLALLILIALILIAAVSIFVFPKIFKKPASVTSFDECVQAGYPILDSYPARCVASGKSFTQDIGNELALKDLITISTPRPNQTATDPLQIRGAARGSWFFEGSFPIKLVDENGNMIAEGHAQATENWMTENFVPYKATLDFTTNAERGVLILEKDNPSGLPENAQQLKVPVKFK